MFPGYLLFGLSRPRARANICSSQSPGIIWDKHSRRVINPAVRFPLRILQQRRLPRRHGFETLCGRIASRDRPHFTRGINGNEVISTTTLARDAKFLNTCREDLWGCTGSERPAGSFWRFSFQRSRAICLISASNEAYRGRRDSLVPSSILIRAKLRRSIFLR